MPTRYRSKSSSGADRYSSRSSLAEPRPAPASSCDPGPLAGHFGPNKANDKNLKHSGGFENVARNRPEVSRADDESWMWFKFALWPKKNELCDLASATNAFSSTAAGQTYRR